MMNSELVFFILPISALLWQAGGTWNKLYRRLGIPTLISAAAWLFLGWSWWWIGLWFAYFAVTTLPFTLIGDSVPDNWFNWVWLWILGAILGAPAIIIGLSTGQVLISLSLMAFPCVLVGLFATLSNIPATSEIFVWKLCEAVFGLSIAIPPAILIMG